MGSASGDKSFFTLGEAALTAKSIAPPSRAAGAGKADIGGRMRVGAILKQAGVDDAEMPERIAGSTNEVWKAGKYIVRTALVPGAARLRREAHLAAVLPPEVQYPKVVASGQEGFGEWIVMRHRPGVTLGRAWSSMDSDARRSVVEDIAESMKVLHQVHLDESQSHWLAFPEGEGPFALPHQLPATRLFPMIERLRSYPAVDKGLLGAVEQRLREVAGSIGAHEDFGLVHGDLHFENVLVMHDVMVALLDFEWCRPGPRELDLEVLSRFCAHPQVHIGGNYAVDPRDFKRVLSWVRVAYPDLFSDPLLLDRVMLCALSFEIPSLLEAPPTDRPERLSEFHPVNRLADLMTLGTHLERLGFEDP